MNSVVTNNSRAKLIKMLCAFALVAAVLLSWGTAMAQNKISPYETKESKDLKAKYLKESRELKKYLIEKYVHISEVMVRQIKSHLGPRKAIDITGAITPKAEIKGKDKLQRSRAVSRAFILGEPSIFGITRADEIKELRVGSISGYTLFRYRRTVGGLPLEGMEMVVNVSPDEKVTYVSANIVLAPPELYDAVKKKTITQDEAISVIKQDLAKEVITPGGIQVFKIEKFAVPSPPWVIWKADVKPGKWLFRIDAFTGEIINKWFILQSL